MQSSDYSELAGGLATVAIAVLGGPLPTSAETLSVLVVQAQTRLDDDAAAGGLRRQLAEQIRDWAASARFPEETIESGLSFAALVVCNLGLTENELADLDYDADRARERVVAELRQADWRWADDGHYLVAERVIEQTYRLLGTDYRSRVQGLLPAIREIRAAVEAHASRVLGSLYGAPSAVDDPASPYQSDGFLEELASSLVAAGTQAEIMSYLKTLLRELDIPPWPGQPAPSTLERQRFVRPPHHVSTDDEDTIDEETDDEDPSDAGLTEDKPMGADEVLADLGAYPYGRRMLAVLGGPGAGKTWLARHYARRAAQAALDKLNGGTSLDRVELPLFSTWDQWTGQGTEDPLWSLVAASLATLAGSSLPEAQVSIDRLYRAYTRPGQWVLLVLDSLDEAGDRQRRTNRFHELFFSLPPWWHRVVITSRPAAYQATSPPGDPYRDDQRVVELKDLSYPDDVEEVIGAWFAENPSLGERLAAQIRNRDDLRRAAAVPLLLTCCCLLYDPAQPLPTGRRAIFDQVLRRLVAGNSTASGPDPDGAPDVDECLRLLTTWAWEAVRDRATSSGLGDWPDTFTQPAPPPPEQAAKITRVVPEVGLDDDGTVTRRFVHRTILEHLVAEHVATLDTDHAAELLLPHLWYDPDWQHVAPAAIAAHNRHHPGALLNALLDRVPSVEHRWDPAGSAVRQELDQLLLAIAAESEPEKWPPEEREQIQLCRRRNDTDVAVMIRTADWDPSPESVRGALVRALFQARVEALPDLLSELVALRPDERERVEARQRVLAVLPRAHPWTVARLLRALSALHPTYTDRMRGRGSLLAALPTADPHVRYLPGPRPEDLSGLVAELSTLDPTGADRAGVIDDLLTALYTAAPGAVGDLIAELSGLDTTDEERADALEALLSRLSEASAGEIADLIPALSALAVTQADLTQARDALLHALPTANVWFIEEMMQGHLTLDVPPEPYVIASYLRSLRGLHPTGTDLAEARPHLLNAMPARDPHAFVALLQELPALSPTRAELANARRHLLDALPTGDPWALNTLLKELPALHPPFGELAAARRRLLATLPSSKPLEVGILVSTLLTLHPTDTDRADARRLLLAAIPHAPAEDVCDLVMALAALRPTEADRAEARNRLLAALDGPTARPSTAARLTARLPALAPTDSDRAEARHKLQAAIRTAEGSTAVRLLPALIALVRDDADRAQARHSLLVALLTADPPTVAGLAAALAALRPTDTDTDQARQSVLAAFPTAGRATVGALTRAMRWLTNLDEWLDWLNGQE